MTSFWIGNSAAENKAIREQQIDIRLNGWYYLGASGDPKLVKVLRIFGDMFEYIDIYPYSHNEGKPSRIETRIGQDLIAMAQATMLRRAAEYRKYTEDWQQELANDIQYTIAHHDLPEFTKQDIDLTQAESEVCATKEAQDRRRMWGYMIEDAQREQEHPDRTLEASIASVIAQGRACTVYLTWHDEPVTFYPDGDYAWGEDHNVYPFDTQYFPVVCSICGQPITEGCINGPQGTKQHSECCNKVIDDKLAAEREARSLAPAPMLSPFKITFAKPGGDLVSWTRFYTDEYAARQSAQKTIEREHGPEARVVSVVPDPVTKIAREMDSLFAAADSALSVIGELSAEGQRAVARQIIGWMNELHGLYTAAALIDSKQTLIHDWQTRAAAIEQQAWGVIEGKRKSAPPDPMIANVYHNGKHTRLKIEVADLPELIYRSGWTVTNQIDNLTDEARAEIARLETLEYLEGQFGNDWQAARAWWQGRVISETDALTPDM